MEKYKIYISNSIKQRLLSDAELFEFFKKNGQINLNSFTKTMIVNYFDDYCQTMYQKREIISSIAKETFACDIGMMDSFVNKVLAVINDSKGSDSKGATLTLTVSGKANDVIETIIANYLETISLSEYIRNMFVSYLSMPRSDRERIVFKEQFNELENAIRLRRSVNVRANNQKKDSFNLMPYMIVPSKQEQFNYLLCYDTKRSRACSFRLSRVKAVFIRNEHIEFDDKTIEKFETAKIKGPQFAFEEVEHVCVKLTEDGKRKYRMIYTNRPDCISRDGDLYYFEWPIVQLEEYFKRFGEDAIIISPVESRERMLEFYQTAINSYKR